MCCGSADSGLLELCCCTGCICSCRAKRQSAMLFNRQSSGDASKCHSSVE